MLSSRSFYFSTWIALLVLVPSFVFCTDKEIHIENFLNEIFQGIKEESKKESKCSKNGSLSLFEQGSLVNKVAFLQTSVYHLYKVQKPFEAIAEKSRKKNGLSEVLERISGADKFLEILENCRSARSKPPCDAKAPYRTYDGTCNNLKNPKWGSVLSCNERILKASYEGQAGFRKSVKSKKDLPSPRYLSLNPLTNYHYATKDVSNMFTFFGQMLDHDLTNTAPTTQPNGSLQCCPPKKNAPAQCAPILISPEDPFYSEHNITCFNFVRNAACPTCKFDKRVQMNQVTSYIDCSFVYSTSEETAKQLRTMEGGMLKMNDTEVGELLPRNPNADPNQCGEASKNEFCFKAGDGRVNQHTPLMCLQTIFSRQHNEIAKKLGKINPHWNDEKLYQETRRIMISIMQNIVYQEYLPLLLGKEIMTKYKLWINGDYCAHYDSNINAAMLTEFTTASFRLHAMVNYVAIQGELKFRYQYNFARPIYQGYINHFLIGMISTPSQEFGPHLAVDVTDFLYRPLRSDFGSDLASFNIQRGRDHGLPSYPVVLEYFMENKIKIKTFDDLKGYICDEYIELLEKSYEDVRDIDLWVGLLMECTNECGIVGETSAHITGKQFYNLKYGDRYFFCNKDGSGSFTEEQIKEIKKSSLSGVFCETTDIKEIYEKALLLPSDENRLLHCSEIPKINLEYWKS